MRDSNTISILKALTWQLLGLCTSLAITWGFTGSVAEAGAMTLTMTGTAFVMYFLHERLWARLQQGRARQQQASLPAE